MIQPILTVFFIIFLSFATQACGWNLLPQHNALNAIAKNETVEGRMPHQIDIPSVPVDPWSVVSLVLAQALVAAYKYRSLCNLDRDMEDLVEKQEKIHGDLLDAVKDFVQSECVRAGHRYPEKLRVMIRHSNNESDYYRFSFWPFEACGPKTAKYHIVGFSRSEVYGLAELLRYRDDLDSFRKDLFFAKLTEIVPADDEEKNNNRIEFLNTIISFILNNEDNVDESSLQSHCDPAFLCHLKIADEQFFSASSDSEEKEKQRGHIAGLKIIAYAPDEYLHSGLEHILEIWAACIHHESGHLQQIRTIDLELVLDSLLPLIVHTAISVYTEQDNLVKKIGYICLGAMVSSLLSRFLCHLKAYAGEVAADRTIVNEEKYLLAAYKFFCSHSQRYEQALQFSWQKGFIPFIKVMYDRITDVHPTDMARAKNCSYRIYRLKEIIGR